MEYLPFDIQSVAGRVTMNCRPGTMDFSIAQEVLKDDCYRITTEFKNIIGTPKCILDVGAHIGSFSVLCAKLFPEASIIAVEPEDWNHTLLTANSAMIPTLRTIRAAVGSPGEISIRFGDLRAASAPVGEELNTGGWNRSQVGKDVPCVAVGDLLENIPDLVKLDCEGGEYGFLRQAGELDMLCKLPFILGEWHRVCGSLQDLIYLLKDTHTMQLSLHMPHGGVFWATRRTL